jgi:hypothetical protein
MSARRRFLSLNRIKTYNDIINATIVKRAEFCNGLYFLAAGIVAGSSLKR